MGISSSLPVCPISSLAHDVFYSAKKRYTRKDTQFYFDTILPRAQEALQEIHRHVNVDDNAAPRAVGAFPLAALRYHRPPSTPLTRETIDLGLRSGQLVGVVSAFPWEAGGIGYEQMIALPPAEQIWEVAYDLLPTLQGKGLGRGVMQCVVDWAEWVGIGKLIAVSRVALLYIQCPGGEIGSP